MHLTIPALNRGCQTDTSRVYYDPTGLLDLKKGGVYWYRGGFEWRAVTSLAIAIVIGFSFTVVHTSADDLWFSDWLSQTWIGANGLAWIATFIARGPVPTRV